LFLIARAAFIAKLSELCLMPNTYLDWEQFLGRPAIAVDHDAIFRAMQGKRDLITGAGGCIGSALAKESQAQPSGREFR